MFVHIVAQDDSTWKWRSWRRNFLQLRILRSLSLSNITLHLPSHRRSHFSDDDVGLPWNHIWILNSSCSDLRHECGPTSLQLCSMSLDSTEKPFEYTALNTNRREIRVLRLEKNCDPDIKHELLRLSIFNVRVRDPAKGGSSIIETAFKHQFYYAISYAWSEKPKPTDVILNGTVCSVPDSAEEALRGLLCSARQAGLKRSSLLLWIDGVCINQNDPQEKMQQIAMMGDVYTMAKGVLLWWGADQGSALADCSVAQRRHENGELLPTWQSTVNRMTLLLKTARWFSRLWVVQELILARKILCFRGQFHCSWEAFAKMIRRIKGELPRTHPDYGVLNIVAVMCDLRQVKRYRPITELLGLNLHLNAVIPHDRVLAILGLLQGHWERDITVSPTYDQGLQPLYESAAHLAMNVDGNLDVLWHAVISRAKSGEHDTNWPTWVPRYHALDAGYNMICTAMLGGKPHSPLVPEWFELKHFIDTNGIRVNGILVAAVINVSVLREHIRVPEMESQYGMKNWASISDRLHTACLNHQVESIKLILYLLGSLTSDAVLQELSLQRSNATYHAILKALPSIPHDTAPSEVVSAVHAAQVLYSSGWPPTATQLAAWISRYRPALAEICRLAETILRTVMHCSLFRIHGSDTLGIASHGITAGDQICVLFGARTPYAMRCMEEQWRLVAIANISGPEKVIRGRGHHYYGSMLTDFQIIAQLEQERRLETEMRTFDIV